MAVPLLARDYWLKWVVLVNYSVEPGLTTTSFIRLYSFDPNIICNLSFSPFVAKLWNEIHCHIWHLPKNKFKKTLCSKHLSPQYSYVTLVSGYRFDSCQSTITRMSIRMSTIKLNTDCICLGHLASNAWSFKENLAHLAANQSERAIVAI